MITTNEMRILLRINGASSYTHTINEVTNVTNNYNRSVGSLISTLAKLVSAGAMIKFSKQCIEAASDLQEVANVTNVAFGQSAQLVNDWAKSKAANFGLSETAAKRYVGTFGTMAKQFNMTAKDAAYMGIEITKLTGDVASFYNISDTAAATKLKAIFTGETEGLKELGVVMTQTQLDAYAMANGWNKTTKEMTEQEKVLLRYQYTMEKLSHAQGDFARTSDGYANRVRTLKLELENMKIEIGSQLIPVAAMGIQAISQGLQVIGPVITNIATNIRLYAQAWQNASERTKTFAKIALTSIGVMLIIPKAIGLVTKASALASKAFELLTVKALTLKTALMGVLGVLGIVLAVAVFKELSKEVDELKKSETALGQSAEISADATDELAESLSNLSDSTKGLDTFLASFDEVNKVGGNSSLMSSLVTSDDLSNILGAASGIEDLQAQLNSMSVPDMDSGIFSSKWWEEKKRLVKGFINTFGTAEFLENWKSGAKALLDAFDNLLKDLFPKMHQELTNIGAEIFDLLHPNAETDNSKWLGGNGETFTFTSAVTGKTQTALKYNSNGTATDLYKKYGMNSSANKTVSNTATQNNSPIDITLLVDGRKIADVVTDMQNARARSSGGTALVGG